MLKKIFISTILILSLCISAFCVSANDSLSVSDYLTVPTWAEESLDANTDASSLNLGGKSIILVEETTGRVLYERDADIKLPPASITKIMTLLLTMEALEKGEFALDTVITCSEHAASMGGSQIWLEPGEKMSVDDILKAVCIKSANDAAVVLAELVGGSEDVFVSMMNERAKELGMTNTTFKNASGLDAEGHLSTARDISLMSRALMRYDKIFEYTKIWMDTLRGGQTELVNTNKLIRYYKGATGLKTGTTNGAGSCLSATAERDGLSLIGVVMGFPDSKTRNAAASKLLDYGFSNYKIVTPEKNEEIPNTVKVKGGIEEEVKIETGKIPSVLLHKSESENLSQRLSILEEISAPVKKGEQIGKVEVMLGDKVCAEYPVLTADGVDELSMIRAFLDILHSIF